MSACCRFAFSSAPTGVDIPRPRSTTLLFNNSRTSEISFWGKPSSNRLCLPHWVYAVDVQRSLLDVECISPAFPINAWIHYYDYCVKKGNPNVRFGCNLLKRWSGRRDSNPRRPAWEYGIRLNIENICGHYGAF